MEDYSEVNRRRDEQTVGYVPRTIEKVSVLVMYHDKSDEFVLYRIHRDTTAHGPQDRDRAVHERPAE